MVDADFRDHITAAAIPYGSTGNFHSHECSPDLLFDLMMASTACW
jgi:hypothetical protein